MSLMQDPIHARDYYQQQADNLYRALHVTLASQGFWGRRRARRWFNEGRCPGCGVTPFSESHSDFAYTPGHGCPFAP